MAQRREFIAISSSEFRQARLRMRLEHIGVVGAGVIGWSVAQDLAQTGHGVLLIDIADEILERARSSIAASVRSHHLVSPAAERQDVGQVLGRIHFSTDYNLLADVDFVIENVVEDWDVKRDVYRQLDAICQEECVLAANTSVIPITKLASVTRRASRVLGLHFMNPVPLQPVVEVVRGYHTSGETLELATNLLKQMDKEGVLVKDSPGFASNRVLMLAINEAIFLVHEGVTSAGDVDYIFKRCFGHRMGPLETADLIGLDTVLLSIEALRASFYGSKYSPCPLLRSMVDAGLLGRKSGRGFYTYGTGDAPTDDGVGGGGR